MCGFFGYDIPCPHKLRTGKCTRIHCPMVKRAFKFMRKNEENGIITTPADIKKIIQKGVENERIAIEARRLMYEKYPHRPT